MNRLKAVITRLEQRDSLCLMEFDASGIELSMLLFDPKPSFTPGRQVQVLFKETEVVLGKQLNGEISFSNRFKAVVTAIRKGGILADVSLRSCAGEFCSIITMRAAERLGLRENDEVTVMIKASQLSLEMSHDA